MASAALPCWAASVSPEQQRTRRRRRIWGISIAVFCLIYFISPWLYMSGLRIEATRVYRVGGSGLPTPHQLTTPEWIRVTFTTSQELAAYRTKWRLPFIQAQIRACRDAGAGSSDEIVSQGAGYFSDQGRVRVLGRLPGDAERYAYQADFDNLLNSIGDDHQGKSVPALTVPGGLCFRLHGAMIASGSVRSATLPLDLTGH